jgi:hypothetical protein
MYKPKNSFNVPAKIIFATYTKVNGITKKDFEESEEIIFVSAKSYGGTEQVINDQYVIVDTMEIETWYRPDITSECNLRLLDDGSVWEIINNPENIDRMNRFLKFKVKRINGGA